MEKKFVKVYCYQLYTPKLDVEKRVFIDDHYEADHFEQFLSLLQKQDLDTIGWDNQGKFMVLENCEISDDNDFIEGFFTSGRYGQVADYRHRTTFVKRKSNKTRDEGEENVIHFIIERKTGKLFLQSDGQKLVTKNSVDLYFRSKLELFESKIKAINKTILPLMITEGKTFFIIKTIYTADFFNEIRKLLRIKKATFQIGFDVDVDNEIVKAMREKIGDVKGADQFHYSIVNKERGGGMNRVEDFIKYHEELDKYENIIVEGPNQAGRTKAVKLEDHAKDFDVRVSVNENGIISPSDLINGIIKIVKAGAY
jgi:hypothetical protein